MEPLVNMIRQSKSLFYVVLSLSLSFSLFQTNRKQMRLKFINETKILPEI